MFATTESKSVFIATAPFAAGAHACLHPHGALALLLAIGCRA